MVKVVYFLLKIIELIIFVTYGRKMSKSRTTFQYWKMATPPIIIFSIVEGLRFGRFGDWNLYYFRYKELGENASSLDYELLFRYICNFLSTIGVPYYGFIFLQCLLLIIASMTLLKRFKSDCRWMVPLVLVCITANEMFIRWYLAFSFILLSINSYLSRKYLRSGIWLICGSLCHLGILVIVAIWAILFQFRQLSINRTIAVILLFLSTFVASLSSMMFIADLVSYISPLIGSEDMRLWAYVENTEALLSGEFGHTGIMERSILKNIGNFIAYAPVIYWGKQYMKQYPYGLVFYNMFLLGVIAAPLFLIEIFDRIFAVCLFFFCIVGGIYYKALLTNYKRTNKIFFWIGVLSFIFAILPHVWDAFNRDADLALFIWDANGRNFLNY